MNKWKTILLSAILVLGMAGCGKQEKIPTWEESDFTFTSGADNYTIPESTTFMVYTGQSVEMDHVLRDYAIFENDYESARGLKINDDFKAYKALYGVLEDHGAWEMVDVEAGTKMATYTGQTPKEMYALGNVGALWLDIAFQKTDKGYELLDSSTLQKIWFCEPDAISAGEVVIFSVFFQEDDSINGMACYRIDDYDAFTNWQNWESEE